MQERETINMDGVDEMLHKAVDLSHLVVEVRPEHTKGNNFFSNEDCAICRAIKEQYPEIAAMGTVMAGGSYFHVGDKYWDKKEIFGTRSFNEVRNGAIIILNFTRR